MLLSKAMNLLTTLIARAFAVLKWTSAGACICNRQKCTCTCSTKTKIQQQTISSCSVLTLTRVLHVTLLVHARTRIAPDADQSIVPALGATATQLHHALEQIRRRRTHLLAGDARVRARVVRVATEVEKVKANAAAVGAHHFDALTLADLFKHGRLLVCK